MNGPSDDGRPFKIEYEQAENAHVIRLSGDLDAYAADRHQLEETHLAFITQLAESGDGRRLVIDLTGVYMADSGGLYPIRQIKRWAQRARVVYECRANDRIRRVAARHRIDILSETGD